MKYLLFLSNGLRIQILLQANREQKKVGSREKKKERPVDQYRKARVSGQNAPKNNLARTLSSLWVYSHSTVTDLARFLG